MADSVQEHSDSDRHGVEVVGIPPALREPGNVAVEPCPRMLGNRRSGSLGPAVRNKPIDDSHGVELQVNSLGLRRHDVERSPAARIAGFKGREDASIWVPCDPRVADGAEGDGEVAHDLEGTDSEVFPSGACCLVDAVGQILIPKLG